MKKIILTLFAMLTITTALAQMKVFAKHDGNITYFRVMSPQGKSTYAKLSSEQKLTIKNLEYYENRISEKTYMNVRKEEHEVEMEILQTSREKKTSMSQSHYKEPNLIWLSAYEITEPMGEKDIRVQPSSQIALSSSTPFEEGKLYSLFQVIDAKDPSLVGQPVVCKVLYRRKSNILGSEGKLFLLPLYVKVEDGRQFPLRSTPILRRGLNRSNFKFWTFPLIIPIFIPGTGARIHQDEKFVLTLD